MAARLGVRSRRVRQGEGGDLKQLVLLLAFLLPGAAGGQALEHEVKAAYLFRFLSFIEWPASAFTRPDASLAIGVLGADEVLAELRAIVPGRMVHGRAVSVQRLQSGESVAGLHVLFVGRGAGAQLAKLGQGRPLLVVSEMESGLEQGAVVNFVRTEERVRFEVALDNAEQRNLKISSRMLAVASQVRPVKPESRP
jgi:hypothetical protein